MKKKKQFESSLAEASDEIMKVSEQLEAFGTLLRNLNDSEDFDPKKLSGLGGALLDLSTRLEEVTDQLDPVGLVKLAGPSVQARAN